jgi:hypothetical protein
LTFSSTAMRVSPRICAELENLSGAEFQTPPVSLRYRLTAGEDNHHAKKMRMTPKLQVYRAGGGV